MIRCNRNFYSRMHRFARIQNVTDDRRQTDRETDRRHPVAKARPIVRSAKNCVTLKENQGRAHVIMIFLHLCCFYFFNHYSLAYTIVLRRNNTVHNVRHFVLYSCTVSLNIKLKVILFGRSRCHLLGLLLTYQAHRQLIGGF